LTKNLYEIHPESKDASYRFALALIDDGHPNAAQLLIENEMNFNEKYGIKEYLLGCVYMEKGNIDKAYDLFITSSVKASKHGIYPSAIIKLAKILMMKEDYKMAEKILLEQLDQIARNTNDLNIARELLREIDRKKTKKIKDPFFQINN
jgi:tetratricopeptide (TPR) repeat protein